MRLVMAQLNLLVGDVAGNVERMIAAAVRARDELQAEVIVFPELALSSYPPEDLLLRPALCETVTRGIARLAQAVRGLDVIFGHPECAEGRLYNAASCLRDGALIATYRKWALPNYGVFDEKRYFFPGDTACVVDLCGVRVGLSICEDVWERAPIAAAAAAGAQLIININASPFHVGKQGERESLVRSQAQDVGCSIVYVNLVGGQDELVFDGSSFVATADGVIAARAPAFSEGLFLVEIPGMSGPPAAALAPLQADEEAVYAALVLGVRDYVLKNGFAGVVLGLSGGIDSALTLAIAVDALGPEAVHAVMMPSPYTSQLSLDVAAAQAARLAVSYSEIPIADLFAAFTHALEPQFRGTGTGIAEENLQARIRGTLLMAISNKTGRLVLSTGNKSEMAVGYATLYGDMAGGFAAIKDVPKTLVYRLADYLNARAAAGSAAPVIPPAVIARAPSAELAPDQQDTDSLPPYPVLDALIEAYMERNRSTEEMVSEGFDPALVARVVGMIQRNEYKRRQSAPGTRITRRGFGRDWRYPITCGYASS